MVSTMNTVCNVLRAEGMSTRDERLLEAMLRKQTLSNGPEYVVKRLKVLKQHSIDLLTDEDARIDEPWFATRQSGRVPKGPLGNLYRRFPNPIERIHVVGALINAYEVDTLTRQQYNKVHNSITYRSDEPLSVDARLSLTDLKQVEDRIVHELDKMKQFAVTDLKGNVVPVGSETRNVSAIKNGIAQRLSSQRKKIADASRSVMDTNSTSVVTTMRRYAEQRRARKEQRQMQRYADLFNVAIEQVLTAPTIAFELLDTLNDIHRLPDELQQYVDADLFEIGHGAIYADIAASKWNSPEDYSDSEYIGRIGFIQQPGTKLRTVANPNRFVQFVMNPFADSLAHVVYRKPQVFVKNQEAGHQWVQGELRMRRKLYSYDLSAATDSLNADLFWEEQLRGREAELPLLHAYVTSFSIMSHAPWYDPSDEGPITWKQGQPLGLAGSFQTLTVQNYLAAEQSRRDWNRSHGLSEYISARHSFAVVGDDLIIREELASGYERNIQRMGGQLNTEKMLISDKYGEFLSKIITESSIFPIKPKYVFDMTHVFSNAEKVTKYQNLVSAYRRTGKLSSDMQDLLDTASQMRSEWTAKFIPQIKGTDSIAKASTKQLLRDVLQSKANVRIGVPDNVKVNPESLALTFDYGTDGNTLTEVNMMTQHVADLSQSTSVVVSDPSKFDLVEAEYSSQKEFKYNHKTGDYDRTTDADVFAQMREKLAATRQLLDELKSKDTPIQSPDEGINDVVQDNFQSVTMAQMADIITTPGFQDWNTKEEYSTFAQQFTDAVKELSSDENNLTL